jgi:sulfite reductase alpha subunit-like flavoprotein
MAPAIQRRVLADVVPTNLKLLLDPPLTGEGQKGVLLMRLEDYPKEPRYPATVLKSERITDEGADAEVRELVLEVDRDEFNFEIGQSIGVLVDGPKEFGGSLRQRLYTVADTPGGTGDARPQITLVVRRCDYVDDYSGEQYPGVNSNFICDRKPGDKLHITGPFGLPFTVPEDKKANLLLIGLGTGIAPFRARGNLRGVSGIEPTTELGRPDRVGLRARGSRWRDSEHARR